MIAMRAHKIQLQLDFFSVFNAIIRNVIAPSVSLITLTDLFVGRGAGANDGGGLSGQTEKNYYGGPNSKVAILYTIIS